MNKKNILIYSYLLKRLEDLILFANNFKSNFNIIFIIHDESYIPQLKKHNLDYVNISTHKKKSILSLFILETLISSPIIQKTLILIRKYSIGQYLNEVIYNHHCGYYKKMSEIIFHEFNVDLFITLTDRHSDPKEMGLFAAVKVLNIPMFLPFIMGWNPISNYLAIKDNNSFTLTKKSSSYQHAVFKKYAYQAYKEHYFYHAFKFKVLDKLGILSKMPWYNGGSPISSMVSVPNKLTYNKHPNMGIDRNKLRILGDLSYIPLYNVYKNKKIHKENIMNKYNLQYKKIIIISLANWWEHNLSDEKTHWNIIKNTIESTLEGSCEYSILISLHPSMKLENYIFLEKKYDIKILEERLMHVLPIADIFVADQSSTVPWAIICGIKVLIICYYKNLNLFSDFNSIIYAKRDDEITERLNYLISKRISFKHDWDLLSRDTVFNDEIVQNYINTLNKLINNK